MQTDVVLRRIVALILDGILLFVCSLIILTLLNALGLNMWDVERDEFSFSATTTFGGTVASALLSFAYKAWLEGTRNGQTLGKQALGIRVVQERDGQPISIESAMIRAAFWVVPFTLVGGNGLWLVSGIGFLWLIAGLISLIASPTRQRLGDRVAHTIVVRDHAELQTRSTYQPYGVAAAGNTASSSSSMSMVQCQYCRTRFTLNLAETKVVEGRTVRICPNCGASVGSS